MGCQLVMVQHGESQWNKRNLFTGRTDVDLSESGRQEAACFVRTAFPRPTAIPCGRW